MSQGPKVGIFVDKKEITDVIKQELPDADIRLFPVTIHNESLTDEMVSALSEIKVIYGYPRGLESIISRCPKVRWLQSGAAGVDRIINVMDNVLPETRSKLTITRNGETFCRPLAEYVIGQILAVNLGSDTWRENQRLGQYKRDNGINTKPLVQSSVAILGLGCIGEEVARTCKHFGMRVWGMTRTPVPPEKRHDFVDQYRTTEDLVELLGECDYIVNVLPSTPHTRGLLSGDAFSHCRHRDTTFINVGRGDVTDEQSLLQAMRQGWLYRAVLDVHAPEPLPSDSELWKQPGVIITPHISGGFAIHPGYLQDRAYLFIKQYRRYVNKEPLLYVVDLDRGY